MRIALLDKLIGEWAKPWIIAWFLSSTLVLALVFWFTTERRPLDLFYLEVSVLGLMCVVGLAFRHNVSGNGMGIAANAGEVVVHATSGSVGLMLAPAFNFFTHICGLAYWARNAGPDGRMTPRPADGWVWALTITCIVVGLLFFPDLNDWLDRKGHVVIPHDGRRLHGIDFFWINMLAFVLSMAAQTAMILRYTFNWWLWTLVNVVWLVVNLMSGNFIFAAQTLLYQVNTMVGLYAWHVNTPATAEEEHALAERAVA